MGAKKHSLNVYVATCEHKEIKEPIVTEVKTKDASSVLDVGCGYGFLMSRLNTDCSDTIVTGVDISRYQVINAKLRRVNGHLVVCCAEYMPFKSDFFDFVLCSEVIEHVVNPKDSLNEMVRLLRKQGSICVTTDNPLSFFRRISRILFETINLKKSVKEEYISSDALIELMPRNVKIYKVENICPYPLLPMNLDHSVQDQSERFGYH